MIRRSVAIHGAMFLTFLTVTDPRPAAAGTCTVVPGGLSIFSVVPSAGQFTFTAPNANVIIPMDVDEATGKVTVDRSTLPEVDVGTQGGPVVVKMAGDRVSGTIDGAGNVWLPDFNVDTLFAGTIDLLTNPTLTTATQAVNLNGIDFTSQGVALDVTTGRLTLSGADIVPNAPIVEEPVISGLRITCLLAPIPDLTRLARPGVKGLVGTATSTGQDALELRLNLDAHRRTIDLKRQDAIVRIATADGHDIVGVLSNVQKTRKPGSKRARLVRTVSVVLPGAAPTPAPSGTRFTLRGNRRRATVSLSVPDLDLTGLAGNVVVSTTIGPNVASVNAVAAGGKITLAP